MKMRTNLKMMKLNWAVKFGIFLVALSIVLYTIHFIIFQNFNHIFLWSMTSLAFLPLSVLFVSLTNIK